jgi:hypothetical protein
VGDLDAASEILGVFPALRPLAATLGWDLLATTTASPLHGRAGGRRSALHDSRESMMAALWGSRRGRALHVVYSTSHTSSSSDWLKDLSANEKSE